MAQSVRSTTLIHEVVGSNPAVTLSVLPKLGGWMTMLQRSKSRPTKSDLHLGKFHSADYCSMRPCTLKPPGVTTRTKCLVHVSRIEEAVYITFIDKKLPPNEG